MRHPVRALAATGALAGSLLLAGCDKPTPKITVQSGSYAATISPSTYCFDATHCRDASTLDLPVVHVDPQGTVLVDVPRDVVDKGWVVNALSLDGKKGYGSSGTIRNKHSYRLISGIAGGSPFIVEVDQGHSGEPDGSRWSFLVKVRG